MTAQFLHQHKDKVVYEKTILIDSPRIEQYYTSDANYLVFEIPVDSLNYNFMQRWLRSTRFLRVTLRSLRFVDVYGTNLYSLSQRPLKVKLDTNNRRYNMWVIEVTCLVSKDEISELVKFFQK